MKKYKLIKEYPGSPKIGSECTQLENDTITAYPEFWEEVVELCVPVGTKFTHEDNNKFVYTIDGIINNNKCVISWDKNKYERSQIEYNILFVNELFQKGTCIEYKEPIIYCITEDEYEITNPIAMVWWIDENFKLHTKKASNCKSNVKYYSSSKSAENFVKCNKPVLNYNEVLELLDEVYRKFNHTLDSRSYYKDQLTKLVKSKLNMND